MKSKQSIVLCSLVAIISVSVANSFQIFRDKQQAFIIRRIRTTGTCRAGNSPLCDETRGNNGKTKFGQGTNVEDRFLSDFKTADGSSVDPYKILQIKRSATSAEIKQSYRRLSRKLHPDMVAQSDILPGRCANLADVRDEWERVKLSYEILSDPKTRKNYDRNSSVAAVLKDPGGAVGRAVVGGAVSGIGLVLGGAWKLGEMATKKVYETAVAEREKRPSEKNAPSPTPPVINEPDTRSDSIETNVISENKSITPGTRGSVRYNYSGNPRSLPMAESPSAMDTPGFGESKKYIATSPGSNGIIEKDSGDANMNPITLLTPEPSNSKAAGSKKKRKLARKGGRGFRKNA
ncbi:hypothetical protein ACHAXA_006471 [Cyclostephanos tholiformis]|uniref:J domain-containing protein n=1 Tax=Cyclostephanos tholiformis TaxID=382380 RepID=A0ABD3RZE4_9STRA